MSVSTLALDSSWRDYVGMWNSFVEPQCAPLEESSCHASRFAVIPAIEQQIVPASGKINYNFQLPAGSLVWGFWLVLSPDFVIQLTAVDLGHKLFQEPAAAAQLITQGSDRGRYPSFTLLPCPLPVVGEGLFTLEAWGTPGDRFYMVLGVAEVTDCPVR